MAPTWLRHGWLIGVVAARRHVRRARTKPVVRVFQWLPVVVALVVFVGETPIPVVGDLWSSPGAYVYGQRYADGAVAETVATVRGTAGVVFLLLVYGGILNQINEGDRHHRDGLLTAVSPRAIALGGAIESIVDNIRVLAAVAPAAVAFAVGAGPVAGLTLFLAGAAVVVTAPVVGYAAALGIQAAFARSETVRENKVLFGAPLALGYFSLFIRFRQSSAVLGTTPIGWYGDLGLLGVGTGISEVHAVAAVVGTVLLLGVAVETATVFGRLRWFADPPLDADDGGDEADGPSLADRGEAVVASVGSRQTAAVARAAWRRLRREPKPLLFVALPILVTFGAGESLTHRRPAALPLVIAIYGSTAVGMGVTLNPLGAAGAALPSTLSAPNGRRHLIDGLAWAMGLPGTAVVVAATVAGGLVTPGVSLPAVVGIAVLAAVFSATATFASLGIGTALPRFDGLDPTDASTIAVPRIEAISLLLLVAVTVGIPALLGLFFPGAVVALVGGSPTVAAAGGVALSLCLAGTASWLGYRRAVGVVDRFEVGG